MKKIRLQRFVCFCTFVILLSGCQQITTQPASELEYDSVEWISTANDIEMEGMNLYWQHDNIQFAADDDARLSLYVNAVKDSDGEILFDDGQDWLLIMETSLGDYPLFPRQYVQLGGVSCVVYNDYVDEDIVSHVVVSVQQTASYQIYDCVFDSDKKDFMRIPIYDAKAINFISDSKMLPLNSKIEEHLQS